MSILNCCPAIDESFCTVSSALMHRIREAGISGIDECVPCDPCPPFGRLMVQPPPGTVPSRSDHGFSSYFTNVWLRVWAKDSNEAFSIAKIARDAMYNGGSGGYACGAFCVTEPGIIHTECLDELVVAEVFSRIRIMQN